MAAFILASKHARRVDVSAVLQIACPIEQFWSSKHLLALQLLELSYSLPFGLLRLSVHPVLWIVCGFQTDRLAVVNHAHLGLVSIDATEVVHVEHTLDRDLDIGLFNALTTATVFETLAAVDSAAG